MHRELARREFDDLEGWRTIDPDHLISPLGCCEGPCEHEGQQDEEPDPDLLVAELVDHLLGHPMDHEGRLRRLRYGAGLCSHCHEEHEIRSDWLGIEGQSLYEDHLRRIDAAERRG